jgi:hypothetical protein
MLFFGCVQEMEVVKGRNDIWATIKIAEVEKPFHFSDFQIAKRLLL